MGSMYSGVFGSHHVPRYPTFALFSNQWYLGKSSLALKEFAVGLSSLVPLKGFDQFGFTNIRCHADKRGKNQKKKNVSGRTEKGGENQKRRTFDGNGSKSPDQEEIIALLRRIQLSISKGEDSQGTQKSSPPHKDQPSVESILNVLRESGKQVKDEVSKETTENETLTSGVPGTEQEVPEHPREPKFRLTTLPSNFARKSPIPSTPVPRRRVVEPKDEASGASSVGDKQGQSERTLERMKLSELKELAKSKKIKGYSKLKKRELIEVLGS